MKEHLYMFSGETVRVKFRITKRMIGEAVELFGKDIAFSDETEDGVTRSCLYGCHVGNAVCKELYAGRYHLEPQNLAKQMQNGLTDLLAKYKEINKGDNENER